MNTSAIRYRVADFLIYHAPFDFVPESELLVLDRPDDRQLIDVEAAESRP